MKTEYKRYEAFWAFGFFFLSFLIGCIFHGNSVVSNIFRPLGEIYIRLLKLTMIPLVTTSIVLSVGKISNVRKAGKIGGMTILVFLVTTAFAVLWGELFSFAFKPGNIKVAETLSYEGKEMPAISETLIGLFPDNALQALCDGKMLPVIVLSVLIGLAIERVSTDGTKCFRTLLEGINQITVEVLGWIMKLTPLGILGLMVPVVIENGLGIIIPLIKVLAVFYSALLIYNVFTYGGLLKCLTKIPVLRFYKETSSAQIFALSSCSSLATLPISMQLLKNRLKRSDEVVGFVLPLGATVNMDGNALYQGIISVFIAQVFGIELSFGSIIAIILVGTLASIGAAGVPGAGVIVLSAVLGAAGLPIEGVALVAGIDRFFDMGRTHTNVTGDMVTACVVDELLGEKDI